MAKIPGMDFEKKMTNNIFDGAPLFYTEAAAKG